MTNRENIERWVAELNEDGMCDISDNQVAALIRDYNSMAVQLANAESKCRELAAENSSKSRCLVFFASVIKSGEEWTSVCEHEYSEALKTPATDAFLAEVRAQGVEVFADDLLNPDLDGSIREFAAQIRKGAKS